MQLQLQVQVRVQVRVQVQVQVQVSISRHMCMPRHVIWRDNLGIDNISTRAHALPWHLSSHLHQRQ